jgi:transcriptional regulator with XRE-family HTH domain
MTRPTLKSFKKAALKRHGVAKEYKELSPAYEIRKKLVALRQEAGLTQEQLAERLNTSKGNISRLESVNSSISPKLSTLADYAAAIGYKLKIDFIPERQSRI